MFWIMESATAHEAETIEIANLTKKFGSITAVDDLSFTVRPGRVTGFLGPNGAGKTTTLRMLLGLVEPTAGTATISGTEYRDLANPLHTVGAALEAASFHPGRTALDHLRAFAPAAGAPDARCAELLDLVGLTPAGKRRVGGFSLGMRQRLALATTLLGDPRVLLLDEPANGLDPEGIIWLRTMLRNLADEGRTVLVSSHMLSEVQQSVDDVVIISRGQLAHASSLGELRELAQPVVTLRSPNAAGLEALLSATNWEVSPAPHSDAAVPHSAGVSAHLLGVSTQEVGACAFSAGLEVHELSSSGGDLESLFLRLVSDPDSAASGQDSATEGQVA